MNTDNINMSGGHEIRRMSPHWLEDYNKGDEINMAEVLNCSDVLYFPDAGLDRQPVETFNRLKDCNVFIYADSALKKEEFEAEIETGGFKGYRLFDRKDLTMEEMRIVPWVPHAEYEKYDSSCPGGDSFWACIMFFERDEEYCDDYGNERFAFIYVCMDGTVLYDALFGNLKCSMDILVISGHGSDRGHEMFMMSEILEKISVKTGVYPDRIFCKDKAEIWHSRKYTKDYRRRNFVDGIRQPVHNLYVKNDHYEFFAYKDITDILNHDENMPLYKFGKYTQDSEPDVPVEWIVLEENEDEMLLLSLYALDSRVYHDSDYEAYWEKSDIRKWLNTDFYSKAFSEEEKQRICVSKVSADKDYRADVYNGPDTEDHVFLLSISETEKYLPASEDRICRMPDPLYMLYKDRSAAKKECNWWLRNVACDEMTAVIVSRQGQIVNTLSEGNNDIFVTSMVRPAIRVKK